MFKRQMKFTVKIKKLLLPVNQLITAALYIYYLAKNTRLGRAKLAVKLKQPNKQPLRRNTTEEKSVVFCFLIFYMVQTIHHCKPKKNNFLLTTIKYIYSPAD